MARLLFFLIALMLNLPAIADDDDTDAGGGEKKTPRAECERQANRQDLVGRERKKFIKECGKEGTHAKRRGEGRDQGAKPAVTQPAAAQPAATAPAPTVATPAQPAATPAPPATTPATTAPAQPTVTPAPPATATTPAAAPKPPKPVLTTEQKRLKCSEEAQRAKIALSDRKQFMDKCMAK